MAGDFPLLTRLSTVTMYIGFTARVLLRDLCLDRLDIELHDVPRQVAPEGVKSVTALSHFVQRLCLAPSLDHDAVYSDIVPVRSEPC